MYVMLQLKITEDVHEKIKARLDAAAKAHKRELDLLNRKIKSGADVDKLNGEVVRIRDRAKRLTPSGLAREALRVGLAELEDLDGEALVRRLAVDPIALGRPRGS